MRVLALLITAVALTFGTASVAFAQSSTSSSMPAGGASASSTTSTTRAGGATGATTTTTARGGSTATTMAGGGYTQARTGARTDAELALAGAAFVLGGAFLFFGQPLRRARAES